MTPAVAVLEVCPEIDQKAAQANEAHAAIVRAERGIAALARKAVRRSVPPTCGSGVSAQERIRDLVLQAYDEYEQQTAGEAVS